MSKYTLPIYEVLLYTDVRLDKIACGVVAWRLQGSGAQIEEERASGKGTHEGRGSTLYARPPPEQVFKVKEALETDLISNQTRFKQFGSDILLGSIWGDRVLLTINY